MISRRAFMGGALAAVAMPLVAGAQPTFSGSCQAISF
jgi:hypothetical protein